MNMANRINNTVLTIVCWLIFITIGLAVNPVRFTFMQNVAAFFVSGVVAFGGVVLIWSDMVKDCMLVEG